MDFIKKMHEAQRRGAKALDDARAILATAESEKRSLTGAERARFDNLKDEHRKAQGEADRLRLKVEAARAEAARTAVPIDPHASRRTIHEPPEQGWVDLRTGNPVTVLQRSDSAVDAFRSRHPDAEDPGVSLGEFLRAAILGPRTDAERRALQGGVDGSGGYAVPDMLSPEILDAVRAKAVVTQAGARVIPMESDNLRVAKITADPTPAWRAELGAVAESDPAFGATDLVARSLAVVTRVSREVMADAAGLEQAVVTALAGAFAAEIDGVALEGSGTPPEPKGLKTQTGLTAHDASSNPLDWALLLAFQQALFAANADALGTLILNPRDWANLYGATGTDGHYVAPPAPLASVKVLNSTQIDATTTSVAYGGAWEEVLIGVRESFGVQILKERYADTGEIGLLCHARIDVGMGRAAKMGRIINLSAS